MVLRRAELTQSVQLVCVSISTDFATTYTHKRGTLASPECNTHTHTFAIQLHSCNPKKQPKQQCSVSDHRHTMLRRLSDRWPHKSTLTALKPIHGLGYLGASSIRIRCSLFPDLASRCKIFDLPLLNLPKRRQNLFTLHQHSTLLGQV